MSIEIGIDSFAATAPDPDTGVLIPGVDRMETLLAEIELADRVGVDSFGIGEHHRRAFLDASPAIILSAAAARTSQIRLSSAVTVLSAADPVRVFQDFATVDLISRGRAEMVVGRGSFAEAYPLFGFSMHDYNALFVEKLELLLAIREQEEVTWSGQFRPPLTGQGVYPRPVQDQIPIWVGVGGTPESFARAGALGLPLMVAIIGGTFDRFRPLVDLYRESGRRAGHPSEALKVGVHAMGFVGDTDQAARDSFYPGWARIMTEVGRERGYSPPSRSQFDAMCGPGGAFLIGSPQTVAEKVIATSNTLGGISRLSFQMTSAAFEVEAMQRSIELLGSDVSPQVKASLANATSLDR